jgi:hypothetical protein
MHFLHRQKSAVCDTGHAPREKFVTAYKLGFLEEDVSPTSTKPSALPAPVLMIFD